jgi:hypothetical protein
MLCALSSSYFHCPEKHKFEETILILYPGVTSYCQPCRRDHRQGTSRLERPRPHQHRLWREHRYIHCFQSSRSSSRLTQHLLQTSHLQKQWSTQHTVTAKSFTRKSNALLPQHPHLYILSYSVKIKLIRCVRVQLTAPSNEHDRTDME